MSRRLDRLRALIVAELAASPPVYRLVLLGRGLMPSGDVDSDQCIGHVSKSIEDAEDARDACGQEHPHPLDVPVPRVRRLRSS
jgi:hypothetical protein